MMQTIKDRRQEHNYHQRQRSYNLKPRDPNRIEHEDPTKNVDDWYDRARIKHKIKIKDLYQQEIERGMKLFAETQAKLKGKKKIAYHCKPRKNATRQNSVSKRRDKQGVTSL